MIDVNLLKDLGRGQGVSVQKTGGVVDPVDAAKKIIIIIAFIVVAFIGGKVYNFMEHSQVNVLKLKLEETNAELAQIDGVLKITDGLTNETKQVVSKLNTIRGIFDLRHSSVRTLDSIRANIPNEIYLKSLSLDNKSDLLKINGASTTRDPLKLFIELLNGDPIFKYGEVLLSEEKKNPAGLIEFDISAKLSRISYAQN